MGEPEKAVKSGWDRLDRHVTPGIVELGQLFYDLLVLRKAPEFLFRENQFALPFDFKHAARAFDEFHFDVRELLFERSLQTGGLGFVVSHDTVFDRDTHKILRMKSWVYFLV